MDNKIVNNYIDIALKKLKICKNYDTQYFKNPLPKNCVYGRMTRNLYVYISDCKQFKYDNLTRFVVWVMDTRTNTHFVEKIVEKHTEWYNIFYAFIAYNEWFVEAEPLLCRVGSKPERKQPQTYTGYEYNTPYKHRRILEWEDTFTTERSVTDKPVYYVDNKKVSVIKEKQKKYDKIRLNNYIDYQNKVYK